MKISLEDRSLYLKGLMLLIRKDRHIHDKEKNMMMRFGEILGFEKEFCEDTINELLDNKYILDAPPRFSKPDITRYFIKDAFRLSISDGQIHEKELAWLKAVAKTNSVEDIWFNAAAADALTQVHGNIEERLEANNLEWE